MREIGKGNREKCGIGDSNVLDRATKKVNSGRRTKQDGITDNGLIEMVYSLTKPIRIELTLTDSTYETKQSVNREKSSTKTLLLLLWFWFWSV